MKKLLIASAALAMVAGTAQAQSSVTVYGVVDLGFSSLETKSDDATPVKTKYSGFNTLNGAANQNGIGEAASSRLGFRGTEDLGGGLKANFVLESGISQNTAFTFGGRAYWAGIESKDMGEVRIGRQDALIRSVWLGHDQLAFANVVGNLAHSDVNLGAPTASHANRFVGVNYLSPRVSGFQVVGSVMQQNTDTDGVKNKNATGFQAGANFVQGKFSAAVAMADWKQNAQAATGAFNNVEGNNGADLAKIQASTNGATTSVGVPAVAQTGTDGKNQEIGAAASYDFGMAKVAYIYNKRDQSTAVQRSSHAFSASVPVNPKTVVRLGYGMGDYKALPTETAQDITGMQAAVNYSLSKRTMVYGIYGQEERDSKTAGRVALKSTEYSVGVRHSF
jgi:predicted porin